jgi:hypothetical protein
MVVKLKIDLTLPTTFNISSDREILVEETWFLYTERYNNQILFEYTIKELHPDDWQNKIKDLAIWLQVCNSPLSYTCTGTVK